MAQEFKYHQLMTEIKSIKLKEEAENIPGKVFDGIAEPKFPSSDNDNNSLNGVDANKDGIRDDIEIWINRTAESIEIRKALKDYYRKTLSVYEVVEAGRSEDQYKKSFDIRQVSAFCLLQASFTENKKFLKDYDLDAGIIYSQWIDTLFQNTLFRKRIYKKEELYELKGVLHSKQEDNVKYCESVIGTEQYAKVRKLAQDYYKSKR